MTKKALPIFPLLLMLSGAAAASSSPFTLIDSTIDSTHAAIKAHKTTCEQLILAYFKRIKISNFSLSRGAPINAFVSLNPNALQQARKLDQYYKTYKKLIGPLHCIAVVVKDNVNTIDTPSTSGSLAMLGSQPVTNAFLVDKIKQAGGIIIGKGAMDEFASGMSGISSRSGRVGNAYDPNQNPGGSSGGVAAAVSANFAMVGIGTDNSGSVRIPAAYNGVFGIRPSTGVISQSGIFPRGNLDGVAGVIARNIPDLATTLSVIASTADPTDVKTRLVPRIASYSKFLQAARLEKKRIGVLVSVAGRATHAPKNKGATAIFNKTYANFKRLGATLVDIKLPLFNTDRDHNMAGEVQDINHYLASFPSTRESYKGICLSNRTRTFGSLKGCLDHAKETAHKGSKDYLKVLAIFKKNRAYVHKIMRKNNLDALLMPLNAQGAPSYDVMQVNTWRAAVSSNAGLPAITIIGGYSSGHPRMPVGLQLIGRKFDEGGVIALAYAFASHTPARPLPVIKEEADSPFLKLSLARINNFITQSGYDSYNRFLKSADDQKISPQAYARFFKGEVKAIR